VILNRNVIANLLQCEAWFEPALHDTSRGPGARAVRVRLRPAPVPLLCAARNALFGMRVGAVNVLIANPRDIHQLVKDVHRHPFHVLPAVNTLLNALAEDPGFRKLDFSSLRITIGAAWRCTSRWPRSGSRSRAARSSRPTA